MTQAPAQALSVGFLDPVHKSVLFGRDPPQDGGSGGRYHGHGDHKGGQQAEGDRQGHGDQQFSDRAAGKDHGQEYAYRSQGRGDDRARDLFCALDRGPGRRQASASETEDILHNDDGVIDQHAYAQRKAGQGHHVQGQAREIHQDDREQYRQGDTDAYHDGRTEIPQEQGQDDDGQQGADGHALHNIRDDHGDIGTLVHQGRGVQAFVPGLQLTDRPAHVPGYLVGTGRGALVNTEQDGGRTVQSGIGLVRVVNDPDIRHVFQADGAHALDITEQGTRDIFRIIIFISHLEQPGVPRFIVHVAGRHGEVLGVDHGGKGIHR